MVKRKFKDPVLQKAILTYLLAFLVAYLILDYAVLSQYETADKVEVGNLSRMAELQQYSAEIVQAEELRAEIAAYEARIDSLRRSLPPSLNEAEFLRAVATAAANAGIDSPFDSFEPKSEPRTENNVTTREYEVSFITGYHHFARFIANLSRNLPQAQVTELTLIGLSGGVPERTLRGTVALAVYSSPLAIEKTEVIGTIEGEGEVVEYLTYESHGRRDPFLSPGPQPGESPTAHSANLNNLFYRGMISVDGVPTALVEDSAGFGFSLKVGEKIAGGKVIQITAEELIISAPGWSRRALPVTTTPVPGQQIP